MFYFCFNSAYVRLDYFLVINVIKQLDNNVSSEFALFILSKTFTSNENLEIRSTMSLLYNFNNTVSQYSPWEQTQSTVWLLYQWSDMLRLLRKAECLVRQEVMSTLDQQHWVLPRYTDTYQSGGNHLMLWYVPVGKIIDEYKSTLALVSCQSQNSYINVKFIVSHNKHA